MSGTVVITGASSGIGEACALSFAKLRRPLVLGARRMERLEAVARACREAGCPKVLAVHLDVRDAASIARFHAAAEPETPDVLVNNAGLARGREPLATHSDEALLEMVDTNVIGFLRVTRAFLPSMIAREAGHLIHLGSIAGEQVYEGGGIYCATKFALRAISRTLRLELLGTNIRCTEIAPGMVETEFSIVRTGDAEKAKAVYAGVKPLVAQDIADCIIWAVTRPPHVQIQEIMITPTAQAMVNKVFRKPA
jgi:3-hydroxy acid dehydrogenase / malonic semialdehyde reductase